jgi:uncharacterized cofD-like protein
LKQFTLNQQLSGHNAGNMLLTMLSQYTGSFPAGVQALAEILEVRGRILPVTVDRVTLVAELTDGSRIYGEKAIDIPRGNQREKIRDVFLVPHHSDGVSVYPPVIDAIREADYVIVGPGDLFTSIIPTLIVPGVREALQQTRARILYVISIMTKFGETHQFRARDFVTKLEERMRRKIDAIIYNSRRPEDELIALYHGQKAQFVEIKDSDDWWRHRTIYASDLLDCSGGVLRHDAQKLANLIHDIISGDITPCPTKKL